MTRVAWLIGKLNSRVGCRRLQPARGAPPTGARLSPDPRGGFPKETPDARGGNGVNLQTGRDVWHAPLKYCSGLPARAEVAHAHGELVQYKPDPNKKANENGFS
jgi:hypothetical protein